MIKDSSRLPMPPDPDAELLTNGGVPIRGEIISGACWWPGHDGGLLLRAHLRKPVSEYENGRPQPNGRERLGPLVKGLSSGKCEAAPR